MVTVAETVASAHGNYVQGVVSCASPLGSGYKTAWTVSNDWSESENATVTAATGGVPSVSPTSFTIAQQGNGSNQAAQVPYETATLNQTLPAGSSGTDSLTVNGKWSDGTTNSVSGSVMLPSNCVAPTGPTGSGTPPAPSSAPAPSTPSTPSSNSSTPAPSTAPAVTPSPTPPTVAPTVGLTLVKTERVNNSGAFVRGPVRARVGDDLMYQMVVTNTGNTSLTVTLSDRRCDAGTLSPSDPVVVAAGQSASFTCSHVLLSVPTGKMFRNLATATGTSPQGLTAGPVRSEVRADVRVPQLRAKALTPAKPAKPVLKAASFTG